MVAIEPKNVWSKREWAFVTACLLLMGTVMWRSSLAMSPTYDEPAHIVSGMAYWQMHDTRLFPEHPPLAKMVAAIPMIMFAPRPDYNDKTFCGRAPCEWIFPKRYLEHTQDLPRLIMLARIPITMGTLFLGYMVYLVARRLFGHAGAALSLLTYSLSPFFLGYGSLVITDIMLALFCLWCCRAYADLVEQSSMRGRINLGLVFAGACLTKFSAGLMLPVFGIAWLWNQRKGRTSQPKRNMIPQLSIAMLTAAFSILFFYAVFCNHTSTTELLRERADSFQQSPHLAEISRQIASWLERHPTFATISNPAGLYATGLICFSAWLNLPGYALGSYHAHGVWYYFPTAFLFKTAPMVLLLLVVFIGVWLHRKFTQKQVAVDEFHAPYKNNLLSVIVITLLVFTASSMASNINLGIRHFSVPIVLLHVLIGAMVPWITGFAAAKSRVVLRTFWITVLVGSTITAMLAFPNYIAYFNFLHGDVPAQDIVNDSNLDWGQSLPAIEQFRAEHGISNLYVNSATMTEPNLYIQGAKPWICGEGIPKEAEWLAVSANYITSGPPSCNYLFKWQYSIVGQGTTYIFHIQRIVQP